MSPWGFSRALCHQRRCPISKPALGPSFSKAVCSPTQVDPSLLALGAENFLVALFFMRFLSFSLLSQGSYSSSCWFCRVYWSRMTLMWREREHEEEDMIALHDPVTVSALRNCGLLKFFRISSMRAQIRLLQYLLDAWDPVNQVFQIRGKSIPLTIVDIYFLTGLSRRGAPHFLV